MADRIKGITIKIGGDTTGLSKSMKQANSAISKTQSELRDVNKLLKYNPKDTELLAQKQKLLGRAVEETKNKLQQLKTAQEAAQSELAKGNITQSQYDALQREIVETESKLKSLEKQAAQSNATMAKIGAVANQVSQGAAKVASATRGISTVAGTAVAAIAGMGIKSAQAADDFNTLSKQTGISTEMLQKAKYAADLIDVSYETFTGSISKMVTKLRTNEEGFNNLGIATRNVNGDFLSTEAIFNNAVKALSQMSNETERDIAAQELFGRSAADLAGIIDDGGAALNEYGKQAKDLGLIMSQDTLNSLNEVNDQLDTLKANALASFAKSGAAALKALQPVLSDVSSALNSVFTRIGGLSEGQVKFIVTILAIVAAISPIAGIISTITGAVSALSPVLSTIFSVVAANPVILIIAGIAAAITALVLLIYNNLDEIKAWIAGAIETVQGVVESVKQKFEEIKQSIVNKFTEIRDGVTARIDALKAAATAKFLAIKTAIITPIQNAKEKVRSVVDAIKGFFSKLSLKLPHIKLPHFNISGKLSLSPPSVPKLSIDWYAKAMDNAMLLNGPTIFGMNNGRLLGGGEAGQEVVAGSGTLMKMIRAAVGQNDGNGALLAEIRSLNDNMSNIRIYLDDGTLVGKLSSGIDRSLGNAYNSNARRSLG